LRYYATSWKVTDSNPIEALNFFNLPNTSNPLLALGLTQPPTEISTIKSFYGRRYSQCIRLTTSLPSVSRFSRKCGFLNIPQLYRLPMACYRINLLYLLS
jgi:hypothetical protein